MLSDFDESVADGRFAGRPNGIFGKRD